MFTIQSRKSSAVYNINANPITGAVDVCFTNGLRYEYDNVSRRAIVNLMLNPNMSLGFWVNDNCVNSNRSTYVAAWCLPWGDSSLQCRLHIYTIHLISHTHMFFVPAARNAIKSTSIKELEVSPLHNQALVTYKNGNQYLYSNIDEDAMFDILFHNVESFGKWVNKFCKADGVSVFPIAA